MGRAYSVIILIFLGITALPTIGWGSSLENMFKEGNGRFEAGNYKGAIDTYSELERLGVTSPELFYNRATSEARIGHLGRAIQYYEKALAISPGDENTVYNMGIVREFIARRASEQGRDADLAPAVGPWRAILDRFSLNSSAIAFLIFYVSFFTALIIRRFIRGEMVRMTMGVMIGVLGVIALSMGIVTGGKWYHSGFVREGVVVVKEQLPIHEGPKSEVIRFRLEEGIRVRILEQRGDWVKVRDNQGRDGWSLGDSIGEI